MARLPYLLFFVTLPGGVAHAAPDLSWMQGSWCASANGMHEEEVWLGPRGNLLLGMHRDTKGNTTTGFEFLRIELAGESATYVAQPGGKPPTRFELVRSSAQSATFENLQHDYPKRIHYERTDATTLVAWIEAGKEGEKRHTYSWRRCESSQLARVSVAQRRVTQLGGKCVW